jgi:uncharacterized protein YraI
MKLRPCRLAMLPPAMLFLGVLLLAAPASAQLAPGMIRTTVTLRAGPDIGFPAVDRLPRGAEVVVHGCLREGTWCDVSFGRERGWIAAVALDYFYDGRYVYLPDYVYRVDVPVVTFAFDFYWGHYYVGRPWFHRYAYWNHYWRGHPQAVVQAPAQPPQGPVAARTGTGMAAPAQPAAAPPQATIPRAQPVAAVPKGGTVGLAATPGTTQPNMGRGGGLATAMHAQMGRMAFAPVGAMSRGAPSGSRGGGGDGHGGSSRRH